jgi:citrate synthase
MASSTANSMLADRLRASVPAARETLRAIDEAHRTKVVSQVTVDQLFGGLRGVKGLMCDTSAVDPDRGLVIRGRPIGDLVDALPEEILWLLLTGEMPSKEQLQDLQAQLTARSEVPSYVWDVLAAMPKDSHPMVMLNAAILLMERESVFRKRYDEGMKKGDYWEPALEDALTLIARLPAVAAAVYRLRFGKGPRIASDPTLDWGANYARMLGLPDPKGDFTRLTRLYLVLHSDHEGGNVSAFTAHTVASALSDVYYALTAGLNGLAGPLHGLANQECLKFVLSLQEHFKGVPSDENLRQFCWDTLKSGKVIPGYGHAVLRVTDPRFTAFLNFGAKVCPEDPVYRFVDRLFAIVPKVLVEQGKAKDPWPNVDAGSGALLYHFGMKEFDYYTVLFSVSRALGICSQNVHDRAYGAPIVRPKSVTTQELQKILAAM